MSKKAINFDENLIDPSKISLVLKKMNLKSATVKGDVPIKLISEFVDFLALPITHIINSMFEYGKYPSLWKQEFITPVPKASASSMSNIKQLRPISGVLNTAKVADKILSEYMITDMSEGRDRQQYGNEKGVSINHLLVKLVDKILTAVNKNNAQEKNAVILTMLLDTGVRKSLKIFKDSLLPFKNPLSFKHVEKGPK